MDINKVRKRKQASPKKVLFSSRGELLDGWCIAVIEPGETVLDALNMNERELKAVYRLRCRIDSTMNKRRIVVITAKGKKGGKRRLHLPYDWVYAQSRRAEKGGIKPFALD